MSRREGHAAIANELAHSAELLLQRANAFQKKAGKRERFLVALTEDDPGDSQPLVIVTP